METLLDVRELSGNLPGLPEWWEVFWMSGRPSRLSGSGRLALPDVQEWSGGPPGYPGLVGRPCRMSESG